MPPVRAEVDIGGFISGEHRHNSCRLCVPDNNLSVAAGDYATAIATECDALDPRVTSVRVMPVKHKDDLAGLQIPNTYLLVGGRGGRALAIGTKHGGRHVAQCSKHPSCFCIPDPSSFVIPRRGDDTLPVGRKCGAMHRPFVSNQGDN